MEFQLVLVRHGYSLGNEKSLFSGWSDVPLTERGRRELRELRQVIRYPRTGRYFSSDLSRCRETFQELYGPHIVLDGCVFTVLPETLSVSPYQAVVGIYSIPICQWGRL